jgi:2-oxoglutarate dehydrogenase E1 component
MSNPGNWPSEINLSFVEGLYNDYLNNPASVSIQWQDYFESIAENSGAASRPARRIAPASQPRLSVAAPPERRTGERVAPLAAAGLQHCVDKLVRAYRVRGHRVARIDPLAIPQRASPELDPSFYGLHVDDMDNRISPETLSGCSLNTPRQVIDRLRETYTRSIGVQFMHIDDLGIREWLQKRMEPLANHVQLSQARQLQILTRLTDATIFEDFIQKKFVGAKSFSLEGCETVVPLLDLLIERAGDQGVRDVVIGMAHRGRLNVLANIMGKNARQIFREFADLDHAHYEGRGDVKYHLGYRGAWRTSHGDDLRISLCFNPSHLEFVSPVAVGRLRARQDRKGDTRRTRGLCILLHGDAAFAGEGVVQETLNMSQLSGYSVGGTIHIIINNQIGFTTMPRHGRSSIYASGVAKMLQIPILHLNGEDPEAAAQVVRLAVDFRNEYQRDVVIDMYGYRRRGHNETDEPRFTQPLLYRVINERKPVREGYLEHLLKQGGVTRTEADRIADERRTHLECELESSQSDSYIHVGDQVTGNWAGYNRGSDVQVAEVDSGVPRPQLASILEKLAQVPEEIRLDPRIKRFMGRRSEMANGKLPLDWAAAEALALGSLLIQGHRVRFSGQDAQRGTFSHRHAVVFDSETGFPHVPLQYLSPRQGPFEILNSPLSECGPLGFEYGYSLEWPDGLIVWEAQFGDFFNAAQVIFDQFISSGEDKWHLWSGLVMLLPHGFEGQGPEHSSARLERFLQLAAEDNIQVVSPTTPAQYFHLLRRQVVRSWRKPLVVMSPKSLLRHPAVFSSLDDLARGSFQRILSERFADPRAVRRVLTCTGKVYYDLKAAAESIDRKDIAIVRLEQLYPLATRSLRAALAPFENSEVVWVQEEPRNMGAWRYLKMRFPSEFDRAITRPGSASPATGSPGSHKHEQRQVIEAALSAE